MIRKILWMFLMLNISDSFLFLNPYIKHSIVKHSIMKHYTTLRMNYLDSLENSSALVLRRPKKPIPLITFDDIFMNINSINNVFLSANNDRVVIFYNDKKGVFYIESNQMRKKVDFLLSLIPPIINVKIITDYPTAMDVQSGELYCTPKKSSEIRNMTYEEIEDIINEVLNNEDDNNNYENGYENDDDDDII